MTKAEAIIQFNSNLVYTGGPLPKGVGVMNPFAENQAAKTISEQFYRRFYADGRPRKLILGINPGRLGAGATGIPFTDTKRFAEVLGVNAGIGSETHEPSSVFVYDVIRAYGGAELFYSDFYINSVCPLGFTLAEAGKRPVNYNYYDSPGLQAAALPFIKWNIPEQIRLAGRSDVCFCLGTGKNATFLNKLNASEGYFGKVIALEHPRYIMQYKAKQKEEYVLAWLDALRSV